MDTYVGSTWLSSVETQLGNSVATAVPLIIRCKLSTGRRWLFQNTAAANARLWPTYRLDSDGPWGVDGSITKGNGPDNSPRNEQSKPQRVTLNVNCRSFYHSVLPSAVLGAWYEEDKHKYLANATFAERGAQCVQEQGFQRYDDCATWIITAHSGHWEQFIWYQLNANNCNSLLTLWRLVKDNLGARSTFRGSPPPLGGPYCLTINLGHGRTEATIAPRSIYHIQ
ncbi:hypothetical protein P691DRAFT_789008 [Macrolepiota fuliginosa MF-IS2]|uniref:Uncharacterized protein n=1 Tax=Macrolepiota fuliginosa MF-IS2 TaxID=1400762 RepID=A0A9P5XGJ8_9AGAR|nr:hypothetical protein P691DRAFT_789008 [Macrolepiota fuliginosa MF-IS2]